MDRRPWYLVLGFLLAACTAEIALIAFPVSTGYHLGGVDEAHPISLGEPRFRYTYSRDWNFHLHNSGALNNVGLRASYDFHPDPSAVMVIGNSFVQADALDPRDTLQERMAEELHRPVYGLGVDGFSLADYLEAARWTAAAFDSHTFVVLLTTGDLDHSCSPRSGQHYLRVAGGEISMALVGRETPSRAKRWLNRSRLFRYLFDNLRVTANWSRGWKRDASDPPREAGVAPSVADADTPRGDGDTPGANAVAPAGSGDTPGANGGAPRAGAPLGCRDARFEAAATRFLLSSFRELEAQRQARVIFLLAPGYRREQSLDPGEIRDVDRFAESAAREGFEIVRLQPAFTHALNAGTRLDFLPIDGHWNAAAHAIAARVCAEALAAAVSPPTDR